MDVGSVPGRSDLWAPSADETAAGNSDTPDRSKAEVRGPAWTGGHAAMGGRGISAMIKGYRDTSRRVAAPMPNLQRPTLVIAGDAEDDRLRAAAALHPDVPALWLSVSTADELKERLTASLRGEALVPLGVLASLEEDGRLLRKTIRTVAEHWTGVPIAVTPHLRGSRLGRLLDRMSHGEPPVVDALEEISSLISRWTRARQRERATAEQVEEGFELTPRWGQVALAVHYGCRRNHLPTALSVAGSTVNTHLRHIYAITGADDFEGLVGLLRQTQRRLYSSPPRARRSRG